MHYQKSCTPSKGYCGHKLLLNNCRVDFLLRKNLIVSKYSPSAINTTDVQIFWTLKLCIYNMAKYITSTVSIYIKHAIQSTKKNQSKKYWDRVCHYVICRSKLQPVSVPVRTFSSPAWWKQEGLKIDSPIWMFL